jgi:hypothetical protein
MQHLVDEASVGAGVTSPAAQSTSYIAGTRMAFLLYETFHGASNVPASRRIDYTFRIHVVLAYQSWEVGNWSSCFAGHLSLRVVLALCPMCYVSRVRQENAYAVKLTAAISCTASAVGARRSD